MLRAVSFKNPFLLCFLSAVLLILSFPLAEFWFLVWAALVPFFLALEQKRLRLAFALGYFVGFLFFAGTLYWFIHVTAIGAFLLVVYLAFYFALFAVGYAGFSRMKTIDRLFLYPSLWVVLEFLRAHLLSGFGWVCLGQSQYKNILMIQIADITGMFGVSFLIVMVNFLLKEWVTIVGAAYKDLISASIVGIVIFVLSLTYGLIRIPQIKVAAGPKIAVIQANIPQSQKWVHAFWPSIMRKYKMLTQQAAQEKPDLILWPETAFPGFIWEAPALFLDLKDFVHTLHTPLLLGVVTQTNEEYFNSALLLSKEGELLQQHDKLHLVPFGEYVPLRKFFPFLADIVPIGDFTAGTRYTIFENQQQDSHEEKKAPFSVLICFEDTVSEISRKFTNEGASFLVNITNDAWFLDTAAPFMHLQAAVFRTVENRRSLIRAANTGVSCFIDPLGRIFKSVHNSSGKMTFLDGFSLASVGLSQQKTFYTKFGDVFTYLCFGCILWGIFKEKGNYFFREVSRNERRKEHE